MSAPSVVGHERFEKLGRERIVVGDLFAYDVAVIPIQTKGRYYGSISRALAAKGVPVPDLALGCAVYVESVPGRGYMFVALWSDDNTYTPAHIYACGRACIRRASTLRLPQLAFPLLGGNERFRFVGAMEKAVDDAMDEADERDQHMPEVVFVTDRALE